VVDRLNTDVPPEWYFPYDETPSDVPPLVSFGDGFRYHITGLLHDRAGFPTYRTDEINPWWRRVFAKINRNVDQLVMYEADGVEDARTVVVAYGSTARAAKHAVDMARSKRYKVGLVVLKTIWPFNDSLIEELTAGANRVIVPEMNMGQLVLEVERVLVRSRVRRVNRVDGNLITPRQILEAIEGV
jgi:2-oxoglutarate ferredoxin oxidoreductase subunit alpha